MNKKVLVALTVVLLVCLPLVLLANGATGKTGKQPVQRPTSTQPIGRGPGMEVATVSEINQRGHVNNMCEAQAMLMDDINKRGGMQTSGDYTVVYLLDPPKGWYQSSNGSLSWRAPATGETQHIETAIMDSLTGQMLPMTGVTLDVVDQQGNVVQSQALTFLWHPMISHYGNNYKVPTAGTYTLRVRAPAPNFWRHNKELGDRFTQPVDVSFTNVQITPKAAPPEEMGTAAGTGTGPSQPATAPECPPGTVPKQ